MDPRFIQWQNYRPTRRPVQPSPNPNQTEFVRPVQQPTQRKSQQQQTRRGGCCGGRRNTE